MDLSFLKKFKYREIKIRYVVLIVVAAVVFRYWGENSITMLQKEVPVVTTTELSSDEIARYVQTKQAYIAENINVSQDIIVSRDLESYLDKETHEWFLLRGWRPARFFYVESRVQKILDLIHKQQEKLQEASQMEEQADRELQMHAIDVKDPQSDKHIALLKQKAKSIRYYIDKDIRQAGISIQEEKDIRTYLPEIEEMFGK